MDERRCELGVKCAMTRIRDIEKQALNDLEALVDLDRVILEHSQINTLKELQVAGKVMEKAVAAFYAELQRAEEETEDKADE